MKVAIAESEKYLSLNEACKALSISVATGKNWVKLEKLIPDKISNNKYFFSELKLKNVKTSILNGSNSALKSRRNKTYVSGNSIYKSYICEKSKNIATIQLLLDILSEENISLSDEIIMLLVAECAIQLYEQRKYQKKATGNLLYQFLSNKLKLKEFEPFIDCFIKDKETSLKFIKQHSELFTIQYYFEQGQDILGLLYLSTKNIGKRKATGAYYTPTQIVKQLIKNINFNTKTVEGKKLLDPCCGTGNFLLQLPESVKLENIFANDIDTISAQITKINLALHFNDYNYALVNNNVTSNDYLRTNVSQDTDYIIGNPPWGYKFSEDDEKYLKKNFKTAQGKNIESFDVIIELSLKNLNPGGILSFVLPESILNVKTHKAIRELLIESNNLQYLEYLGNAFDGVQCPAIILQTMQTLEPMNCAGLKVKDSKRTFTIKQSRNISSEYFSFKTNDKEYSLLNKLQNNKKHTTLYNQSDFALGIVTGNNSKFISHNKTKNNEPILKGSNIYKYGISQTENHIKFMPETFQQVAPTQFYRAKEKLLYRFICNQLVFAYDNQQTLSLNSCNILIPKIKDLDIKYIMAVLNSRIAQFIYTKQYNSVKILRSHIEQLPIPVANKIQQEKIITLVDKLLSEQNPPKREQLYSDIDNLIFELFEISPNEQKIVIEATETQNKFLY